MDKKQTALLLKEIDSFFPGKIKLEPATVESWYRIMQSQDYAEVIFRLDQHVVLHKFVPTIHDLFEKPRPEHDKSVLQEIVEWEGKSCGAPREH